MVTTAHRVKQVLGLMQVAENIEAQSKWLVTMDILTLQQLSEFTTAIELVEEILVDRGGELLCVIEDLEAKEHTE